MPANTQPIFTLTPNVELSPALIRVAASNVHDGSGTIGTDVYKIFTAGANGSLVRGFSLKYVASAATISVAAVMKFYISSATSGAVTDANCILIAEFNLPAITPSTTVAMPDYYIPINRVLENGQTILAKITAAQSASCGYVTTSDASDY